MEAIGSLIETALWVGLFAFVIWRYAGKFDAILGSINQRISQGAEVRAVGITLGPVTPQSPYQQKERLDQEVAEASEAAAEPALTETEDAVKLPFDTRGIRWRYLTAEDFALRQIQSEYGAPLTRQGEAAGVRFDGFFVKDGTAHIVEVKYTKNRFQRVRLEQTAERIVARAASVGWKNFRVIIAIVYGDADVDLNREQQRLAEFAARYDQKVEVRCFKFADLARQLGVDKSVPDPSASEGTR